MTSFRIAHRLVAGTLFSVPVLLAIASLQSSRPEQPHTAAPSASSCGLEGSWQAIGGGTVNIESSGTWHWRYCATAVNGFWSRDGDRLRIFDRTIDGPGIACPSDQPGTYRIKLDPGKCMITLALIEDPCAARSHLLSRARLYRPPAG